MTQLGADPHVTKVCIVRTLSVKIACFNVSLRQRHLKHVSVPFGSRPKFLSPTLPSLMRRVEDPLWDLGVGFGQVPDRGAHLRLPWEHGSFSFVSGSSGSQDPLEELLRQPEPVPLPEVPEELRGT